MSIQLRTYTMCTADCIQVIRMYNVITMKLNNFTFIKRKCIKFLTKITATQNEVALSYHRMRGLHFLAVIFAATIVLKIRDRNGNRMKAVR